MFYSYVFLMVISVCYDDMCYVWIFIFSSLSCYLDFAAITVHLPSGECGDCTEDIKL